MSSRRDRRGVIKATSDQIDFKYDERRFITVSVDEGAEKWR